MICILITKVHIRTPNNNSVDNRLEAKTSWEVGEGWLVCGICSPSADISNSMVGVPISVLVLGKMGGWIGAVWVLNMQTPVLTVRRTGAIVYGLAFLESPWSPTLYLMVCMWVHVHFQQCVIRHWYR